MFKDKERIGHIIDAIEQIKAIKLQLTYDSFVADISAKWLW
jgi:hypothetical protein